jgi:hypothetical protein
MHTLLGCDVCCTADSWLIGVTSPLCCKVQGVRRLHSLCEVATMSCRLYKSPSMTSLSQPFTMHVPLGCDVCCTADPWLIGVISPLCCMVQGVHRLQSLCEVVTVSRWLYMSHSSSLLGLSPLLAMRVPLGCDVCCMTDSWLIRVASPLCCMVQGVAGLRACARLSLSIVLIALRQQSGTP